MQLVVTGSCIHRHYIHDVIQLDYRRGDDGKWRAEVPKHKTFSIETREDNISRFIKVLKDSFG